MLKLTAQFLSALFHPLLIVTYMLALLLLINPYSFGVHQLGEGRSGLYLMIVFFATFLMPLFAIWMMKKLDMLGTTKEYQHTDRIGPFLVAGVLYLFQYYNFHRLPDMPLVFKSAFLGVIIALFIAFFLSLFSKISLHTVGMGALVGLVLVAILLFNYDSIRFSDWELNLYILLFIMILLAGIVGSARLLLEEYVPKDLYGGYLVGFATQLIALQFLA